MMFAISAHAADVRCGVDTDVSGAVDQLCPVPDKDGDGYYSNGSGRNTGTDCDDENFHIFPGVSLKGDCSSGEFKTCQADGTYTACAALSTFTCKTGSGVDYWIDDSVSTCHASNSFTNLSDIRCFSDSSMTNYHAPVAGDCFIFKTVGTYSNTWGSSPNSAQVFLNNKDGTAGNPIKIRVAPGAAWWESGVGVGNGVLVTHSIGTRGTDEAEHFQFSSSNYVQIDGFEIDGSTGYSNAGIAYDGTTTGGRAYNNYIHDIRANCGNNNCGGLKCRNDSDGIEWDHNIARDNWDVLGTESNNLNSSDYVSLDCDQLNVHDNVSYSTDVNYYSYGIKFKHGVIGAVGNDINYNIVANKRHACVEIGGIPHTTVSHNYLKDCNARDSGAAIKVHDDSSTDEYTDLIFTYNTIINSPFIEFLVNATNAPIGTPFATIQYNVAQDDETTAYSTGGDAHDGFFRFCHYCADSVYTTIVTGGIATIDNNCYYNASQNLYFSLWGDGVGSGSIYANFTNWQGTSFGYDDNSYSEDPSFDVYGRATSSNCADKGWLLTSEQPPTAGTGAGVGRAQRLFQRRF